MYFYIMTAPIFKTLDELEPDHFYIAVFDNGNVTEYSHGLFHPRLGGAQIANRTLFEICSNGSGTLNYFYQFSLENNTHNHRIHFENTIFLPVESKESLRDYLDHRTRLYHELIQSIDCGRLKTMTELP